LLLSGLDLLDGETAEAYMLQKSRRKYVDEDDRASLLTSNTSRSAIAFYESCVISPAEIWVETDVIGYGRHMHSPDP
jgi:hypothetical protein